VSPDTYADSHINNTAVTSGAAVDRAAQNKLDRYVPICATLTCSIPLPLRQPARGSQYGYQTDSGNRQAITVVTVDIKETLTGQFVYKPTPGQSSR